MPKIEDLLIEMKETVEHCQICHRDNQDLELSYLMGRLTGRAILIHELVQRKFKETKIAEQDRATPGETT